MGKLAAEGLLPRTIRYAVTLIKVPLRKAARSVAITRKRIDSLKDDLVADLILADLIDTETA